VLVQAFPFAGVAPATLHLAATEESAQVSIRQIAGQRFCTGRLGFLASQGKMITARHLDIPGTVVATLSEARAARVVLLALLEVLAAMLRRMVVMTTTTLQLPDLARRLAITSTEIHS
jgi:hypothetical protein